MTQPMEPSEMPQSEEPGRSALPPIQSRNSLSHEAWAGVDQAMAVTKTATHRAAGQRIQVFRVRCVISPKRPTFVARHTPSFPYYIMF